MTKTETPFQRGRERALQGIIETAKKNEGKQNAPKYHLHERKLSGEAYYARFDGKMDRAAHRRMAKAVDNSRDEKGNIRSLFAFPDHWVSNPQERA